MATAIAVQQRPSLSLEFAGKYGVDPKNIYNLLKETALKSKDPVSDAEAAAFMVVCNQYDLNPFIKEIFGFISKGKMQYVISVDGWATLVNRQQHLNGIEFEERFAEDGRTIVSITCKIHRKDRALPTIVTEYFSECYRSDADTWKKWPIRMLRHKSMIQCSRIAFGLAGVMDEDEAERMANYPAPPALIDAVASTFPEAEEAMNDLGWNETKKRAARRNFQGDRDGFLVYLKGELKKVRGPELIEQHPHSDPDFSQQAARQEREESREEVIADTAPSGAEEPSQTRRSAKPNW